MEVFLKFINSDPWSGITKYPNCATGIGAVWSRSGNRITGLTEEDARRLEKAIGYPEGHLSPMSSFWHTYFIKVNERGLTLYPDQAEDELKYKLAKAHPRVAFGMDKITPKHDFVLIDTNAEAENANKINKTKRLAYIEFNKMSVDEMRKCLRIYGVKSDNISTELVESKLFELIDKDPAKYFALWVNNKNKETLYLIESAIAKNVIRKSRNIYYYGTEIIGRSMDDTIATIDDPKNQDIKMAILQETENK